MLKASTSEKLCPALLRFSKILSQLQNPEHWLLSAVVSQSLFLRHCRQLLVYDTLPGIFPGVVGAKPSALKDALRAM